MDEFPEDEFSVPAEPARRRLSWGAVVGAAFGLILGAIWMRYGFAAALVAAILAVAGGLLGRYYVGD